MIRTRTLLPLLFCIASLPAFVAAQSRAAVCDPRSYGAKAEGTTLDTAAIQKAIDVCEQRGGGTIRFGAGTYL